MSIDTEGQDAGSIEDLNHSQGKIFRADIANRRFELLKETVFDPKTNEGRSRHTVHWTAQTRFVKVVTQNGFAGVDKPVRVHFPNLKEENAALAAAGQPFVVTEATVLAPDDDASRWNVDRNNRLGLFTLDPASPKLWGGTVELDGQAVGVRLRGPMSMVAIRTLAKADDLAGGFWSVKLSGQRHDGRFVATAMEIHPLEDPRAIDNPALPRVLVIGDSISMNYHEAAKAALKGIANYHRSEGNGGPSDRGVACAELWLGDYTQKGLHWDLIQFNHGLHDLKQPYDSETGQWGGHQVSIEDYKRNLEQVIQTLKKTGATLAWCTTTPVPNSSLSGFARRKDEDLVFNKAALEVLSHHPGIRIHDLNTFIRQSSAFDTWRQGTDVHFWGQEQQELVGREVARDIEEALAQRSCKNPAHDANTR